jgi:hypothetical protein
MYMLLRRWIGLALSGGWPRARTSSDVSPPSPEISTDRRWSLPFALTAGLLSCNPGQPTDSGGTLDAKGKPVVAPRPLEPVPLLRLGTRPLVELEQMTGEVTATSSDATHQYLEITFPRGFTFEDLRLEFLDQTHVELGGAAPGDLALVAERRGRYGAEVLVRRRLGSAGPPSGALFAERWAEPGREFVRVPFAVPEVGGAAHDKLLKQRWVETFSAALSNSGHASHPWDSFAAGRVRVLLPEGFKADAGSAESSARYPRTDLSQLMDTTTGVMSMQEALQHDRGLRLDRSEQARTVAVAELAGPPLDAHPFPAMQAALPKPDGGTPETLAMAVPAEFWYARFNDIPMMLRVLDEADAWITPIVQISQSNPEDRHLSERYQAQLGLKRTGLAKLLGHTVVGQVAITGSDPYLREGSDVTLIFSIRQQGVFEAEMAKHLDDHKAGVPGIAATVRDYNGLTITESRDPTGTVRQQRAQVGDLALVSNSPRAIERVLDAIQRRTPRLSDEPDLKYMLARDPGTHPAFAFLSDKFIGAVIGPQQKLLTARRQLALADLLTPGYAALLHGWLFGQAPASTEALVASGLLAAEELKHPDGAPIEFTPGRGASSTWGRPSALTPLIDLPAVTMVSEAERTAYQKFITAYQQYWRQFIDPVAMRLDVDDDAAGAKATLDVRILPLISATDYSEIERIAGTARAQVSVLKDGLQMVWAFGKDARLRRDLDGMMGMIVGEGASLGWLGEWVMLGVEDRAALVELLSHFDDKVQLALPKQKGGEFEDVELWRKVGKVPFYAVAAINNPALLVATLTAIRMRVDGLAPGWVEWGEVKKYRDLPIVRVGISKTMPMLPNREIADAVALYYVQTGQAIALSLDLPTLEGVMDRMLDGKLPRAGAEGDAQFVFEAHSIVGAPLWTSLLWSIQGQANEAQESARRSAEILLRGDPSVQSDPRAFAQLAVNYLGFTPVTAHGTTAFVLGPDGAGDTVLGTTTAPTYVPLPIPGSPVEHLMQRLTGLRGEVSFDKEPVAAGPNARSLHTRFIVQLGATP